MTFLVLTAIIALFAIAIAVVPAAVLLRNETREARGAAVAAVSPIGVTLAAARSTVHTGSARTQSVNTQPAGTRSGTTGSPTRSEAA